MKAVSWLWKLLGTFGLIPPAGVIGVCGISRAGLWVIPHAGQIFAAGYVFCGVSIAAMGYRIWFEHEWPMRAHGALAQRLGGEDELLDWDGPEGTSPGREAAEMDHL